MADTTKERILEAAGVIIREVGPEGLTVEAAADRAGVSRKTVYNHFENRYALLDGAAAAWMGRTLAALQEVADDESLSFVPKLNAIAERGYSEFQQGGRMLGGRSMPVSPGYATVKLELQEKLRALIEKIVRIAMDEGIVRRDFDPRRLTAVIMNIVGGLALGPGLEDEPYSRTDVLKDSLRAVVGGILTPEGAVAMRGSPILS